MKTILVDAVHTFIIEENGEFKIFDGMRALLDTFPNRKIILTGASEDKFKKYCLDKVPYEFFTLKHNPEKSNPDYYKIMLKNFDLRKDEVIYFEHDPDAVKSAQSVGIKTYQYDPKKRDLKALREFLQREA